MPTTGTCLGCHTGTVTTLLDFGPQPPSNRFFRAGEPQPDAHPLALGQCGACALVQLLDPMPEQMVRSRHAWISYNEPEGHLDQLVRDLIGLCRLAPDTRIGGLTYKDDTTLARFNRLGHANTYRYDLARDFDIADPLAGLETIQQAMTPALADRLVQQHGRFDLLLVRHLLEHAHAPLSFLDAVRRLVKPDGYLVFEMPDSVKFLAAHDYTFVWEEHIAYFTPDTVRRLLPRAGVDPWDVRTYPYPLEDSLIVVARPSVAHAAGVAAPSGAELALGAGYGARFDATRTAIRADLARLKAQGKRVAVFGAGHLAAKFLNLFDLRELVDCVIDDNPNKLGLCMPGSGVPVRPSSILVDEQIDLCLLSLSPESEKKVIAAKQAYLDKGGRFHSIFALSPIAYPALAATQS